MPFFASRDGENAFHDAERPLQPRRALFLCRQQVVLLREHRSVRPLLPEIRTGHGGRTAYTLQRHPSGMAHEQRHWNDVYFDQDVPDTKIRELVRQSYDLVRTSLPKKEREALDT